MFDFTEDQIQRYWTLFLIKCRIQKGSPSQRGGHI